MITASPEGVNEKEGYVPMGAETTVRSNVRPSQIWWMVPVSKSLVDVRAEMK
jgi:hypothetical protein